ncbi:GFA family protein [Afifella sp. H1R]|uniref:GFA family protein n=1 Tax=Afifella sp. H1R TaxID=2908841 RepID=UPI001F278A35|nr:GFA family protein [Afifella sp. H1R]MCF1504391.1 GFA family protein [Afifella sp. H1R]
MPMTLKGSCRCGAVHFSVESHTPQPYQLCYCSICRKTAGGGGYAINLGGIAATLKVEGREAIEIFRAEIDRGGHCEISTGERNFCRHCATALWLFDPTWPELIHPFASAIDSELPAPPERVHLMLGSKANWVVPDIGPNDQTFDVYPEESLEGWHKSRCLWVE